MTITNLNNTPGEEVKDVDSPIGRPDSHQSAPSIELAAVSWACLQSMS